jgi:hypothetical protein
VAKLTDDEYMNEYTYLAELMSRQDNWRDLNSRNRRDAVLFIN